MNQLQHYGLCEINLTGDMNLDMYQRNAKVMSYRNWLKRVGLKNMVTEATHIKNVGLGFLLIDHFLTTDDHMFNTVGSLATNASDHFFVYAVRKKAHVDIRKVKRQAELMVD